MVNHIKSEYLIDCDCVLKICIGGTYLRISILFSNSLRLLSFETLDSFNWLLFHILTVFMDVLQKQSSGSVEKWVEKEEVSNSGFNKFQHMN